jgi:hypothetical protein
MTDLKCLRAIYETQLSSNNAILEDYPNEMMFAIMRHLSLRDCAAFTATCKGLQYKPWFPGIAEINPDHIKRESAFRNNVRQTVYTVCFGAGGYVPFGLSISICDLIPDDYEYSKEIKGVILATGFAGIFCFFASNVMFGWLPKIKDAHQEKDQITTVAKTDAYLTHAYHTLAECMNTGQIQPASLKIHYHNNEQVEPLLRAAKHCGVANLTINFCRGDHYGDAHCCGDIAIKNRQGNESLDLFHLLADNTKLKNLTIKGDPYFKDNVPLLYTRFYEGLEKNNHLTSLTLDSCCEVAACRIISIINTTKNIRELIIAHSSPYQLPQSTNQCINALLSNTTLNKFTLINCALDDNSAVALQHFIQFNTKLQSLHIKQLEYHKLSDQSKKSLRNSLFKPEDLILE